MARPPPNTGQTPLSFKTVPGRHRTQKWNMAKQYDYSGDDWGSYDDYDDYGGYDQQPPPPPPQQQYAPQSAQAALPSQQYGRQNRQQSFDQGDETRQFSGPGAYGPPPGMNRGAPSPARSAASGASGRRPSGDYARRPSGDYARRPSGDYTRDRSRPRDFTNPEQVPPPLYTMRGSPAPPVPSPAPPGAFPPRKSSVSTGSPAPEPAPPMPGNEKELPTIPFVRPSDIYKRMEAERERERKSSMESSSRPSMDSTTSEQTPVPPMPTRPLSKVEEQMGGNEAMVSSNLQGPLDVPQEFGEPSEARGNGTFLPPVKGVSSFGSDMWPGKTSDEQTSRSVQPSATIDSLQTTPVATRAPFGHDPAADILAERTDKRAPPGSDPAADILAERTPAKARPGSDPAGDILAERTHTKAPPGSDPAADILAECTHTKAPPGSDPAADILAERAHTKAPPGSDPAAGILAERAHEVPISQIGSQPDSLSHQPSSGYRSMVNRAFDPSDSSQPSDVSRSNTQSTSSVSPIMSRVPSEATAKMQQQAQMGQQVPTIAEEPQARYSSESRGIEKGYRRSLDPPSGDNSPARTPALETGTDSSRRLSEGYTAETITTEEAEAQAAERAGRPRAGTDYSMRESDLAHAVNTSPDNGGFDASAAEKEKADQDEFLMRHSGAPASPAFDATASASGRSSPAKGRVRDLANQFQEIHDSSRRDSQVSTKSSWSNFRGSDENLPGKLAKRQGTDQSGGMRSESDYDGVEEGGMRDDQSPLEAPYQRPDMASREMSFRPQLPGQWVSTTSIRPAVGASPAPVASVSESEDEAPEAPAAPSQHTPRASRQVAEAPVDLTPTTREAPPTPIDLTPTTRKVPREGSHQQAMFGQAKSIGDQLGAAFMATYNLGHKTQDFGSKEPAAEVEQPAAEERFLAGERGLLNAPQRPWMMRGDTDASVATTVTEDSGSSSVAPTPPPKDTSQPGASSQSYFSPTPVAPLRTGKSREATPELKSTLPPSVLSSIYGDDGLQRDDSIRREIVRSLDSAQKDREDAARTQDALDAPQNLERVSEGEKAMPAAEISDESPAKPQPLRMLDQRFSWEVQEEDDDDDNTVDKGGLTAGDAGKEIERSQTPVGGVPKVFEPEPESSPEIRPEMPYERPRSRGLHIMNASDEESSDEDDRALRPTTPLRDSLVAERGMEQGLPVGALASTGGLGSGGPVSPITKSQENLHLRSLAERKSGEQPEGGERSSMRELAPSPISDGLGSPRLPNYYMQDPGGLELATQPTQTEEDDGDAAPEAVDRSMMEVASASDLGDVGGARDVPPPPPPPEKEVSTRSPTTPTSPTSKQGKIPPFREILAIKNPDSRIHAYDSTRRTFANTNTGLSDWLSTMLAQNPQYAALSTEQSMYKQPAALRSSGTLLGRGHKVSPSLSKFTKPFTSTGDVNMQRSASMTAAAQAAANSSSGATGGVGGAGSGSGDLQQRGKDLMKGAGVLGGKAQAGAKGLFAKGRSRFGTQRESKGGAGGAGGGGSKV